MRGQTGHSKGTRDQERGGVAQTRGGGRGDMALYRDEHSRERRAARIRGGHQDVRMTEAYRRSGRVGDEKPAASAPVQESTMQRHSTVVQSQPECTGRAYKPERSIDQLCGTAAHGGRRCPSSLVRACNRVTSGLLRHEGLGRIRFLAHRHGLWNK